MFSRFTVTTACEGLCVLALFMPGAQAADAVTPSQNPVATATSPASTDAATIEQVKQLILANQLTRARQLLAPLRKRLHPTLETLFLSGILYQRRGNLTQAAAEFRRMLVRNPGLPRPRLELARALFQMGDYDGARYNFQQVTGTDISPTVRSNVGRFLNAIRGQVPTYSLDLELITDSNPIQSTSAKTVTIGGLNYQLNTTAPGKAVNGLLLKFGASLPLPKDPSWYLRLIAQRWEFPGNTLDQTYLQAMAGKRLQLGKHTLAAEIGAHQAYFQNNALYHGAVFKLLDQYQQRPTLGWKFGLERRNLLYAQYPYLTGHQYIASINNIFVPSALDRIESGITFIYSKAQIPAYTYTNPIAFVRHSHEWPGGFITGASVQLGLSRYQGIDPFFGIQREDRDMKLEVDVLNRQIQIAQFSPRLSIGYVKHRSNIALYRFKRTYVNIGISRDF